MLITRSGLGRCEAGDAAAMSHLLWLVLLLLLCQEWTLDAGRIDPSRLLVATVVDGSNQRIVTDSFFFFRSIRLFGGTLNDAVLLACIVVEPESAFVDENLLRKYSELGVEIDFIRQTPHPYPKTLNKFATFYKYDSNRFDYFLWLDADIIVFEDPLLALPDLVNGRIYCVPEVYNYMKRFGTVESDIAWNPSLPPFQLAQEQELSIHGVCNTGVLLFDSVSLRLFLNELFKPQHLHYFDGYSDDRFIDSLAFVIAVNSASIVVEPLDYKFNYMAFFELILTSVGFEEFPTIVHFIHDSALYFGMNENGDCYTLYECTHIGHNLSYSLKSMIPRLLQHYFDVKTEIGSRNCFAMLESKSQMSRKSNHALVPHETHNENKLLLVWPVSASSLFVTMDRIVIDVIVEHSERLSSKGYFSVNLQVLINDMIIRDGKVNASNTACMSENVCRSIFPVPILFDISKEPTVMVHVVAFTLPDDGGGLFTTGWQNCSIIFQGYLREYDVTSPITSNKQVLNGQFSIYLDSQLNLDKFLNSRGAADTGIVMCCDTLKGVDTTQNLIKGWGEGVFSDDILISFLPRGGLLLIEVQNSPHGSSEHDINTLVDTLSNSCNETKGNYLSGCIVIRSAKFDSIMNGNYNFFRDNSLSFVYIDIFSSYERYDISLRHWYERLADGGVIIGAVFLLNMLVHQTLFAFFSIQGLVITCQYHLIMLNTFYPFPAPFTSGI